MWKKLQNCKRYIYMILCSFPDWWCGFSEVCCKSSLYYKGIKMLKPELNIKVFVSGPAFILNVYVRLHQISFELKCTLTVALTEFVSQLFQLFVCFPAEHWGFKGEYVLSKYRYPPFKLWIHVIQTCLNVFWSLGYLPFFHIHFFFQQHIH